MLDNGTPCVSWRQQVRHAMHEKGNIEKKTKKNNHDMEFELFLGAVTDAMTTIAARTDTIATAMPKRMMHFPNLTPFE